jgi:hypothetical protein
MPRDRRGWPSADGYNSLAIADFCKDNPGVAACYGRRMASALSREL